MTDKKPRWQCKFGWHDWNPWVQGQKTMVTVAYIVYESPEWVQRYHPPW